jgi:uncharacterized protein (DUF362 family)
MDSGKADSAAVNLDGAVAHEVAPADGHVANPDVPFTPADVQTPADVFPGGDASMVDMAPGEVAVPVDANASLDAMWTGEVGLDAAADAPSGGADGQSQATGGSGGGGIDGSTGCPSGSETCACHGDGSCNVGLTCVSNLCVNLGAGGTGGTSSGGADAGATIATGGALASGGTTGSDGSTSSQYVVAMVQSSKAQASDIAQGDIKTLVGDAITKAGGLDFIKDGQTVVLKPNIVTPYADMFGTPMSQTVNGVSTDWRVTKAVADLVREKNPTGKILVMEGSTVPAATAFSLMGYTTANFGASVDEFIGFEGASCTDSSTDALVQEPAVNGRLFWVNKRYFSADVVISLPTMKTHLNAGITGAVKNLGVGTTPVGQYSQVPDGGVGVDGGASTNCTRGQSAAYIDHSTPETLGQFIHDNYSVRPADFVVMDALQGLSHGPASMWSAGGNYATDKMNMRLILAGRNAVAVDTIEALVMKCDPTLVPHLTKLEADGLGTTDTGKITVVGKQVSDVAQPFTVTNQTAICPGI